LQKFSPLKEKEIFNKIHILFPTVTPPHLNNIAAVPLGIQKFKFVANLEENAKNCHMNRLSFHNKATSKS